MNDLGQLTKNLTLVKISPVFDPTDPRHFAGSDSVATLHSETRSNSP